MSLFQPNDYGKLMSVELSEIFQKFVKAKDISDVSEKQNVPIGTINAVIYRNRKINEQNAPALIELMKIVNRKALEMKSFADLAVEKTKISD